MALIPTTLQSLITQVRQQSNMENNQFVTDPEITTYLNNALSILDDILINKFSFYKVTPIIVSAQPNSNYIQLPLDFVKLQGMDVWLNSGSADGYWTMKEFTWQHRNDQLYPGAIAITTIGIGGSWQNIQYCLEGQQIVLQPASLATQYQFRMWYSPGYIPLINYSDTLQPYMDSQSWCQYAVYEASVDILTKQDLDPSIFMQKAAAMKEHIIKLAAPNRNAGEPKCVSDTRGFGGGPYGWNW